MATITLAGNAVDTVGELPGIDTKAPPFSLTATDLSTVSLEDFAGKTIVLNIFPSVDTSVCAASLRRFNKEASELDNTVVLCVSADLPFAFKRFCEAEGLADVIPLSVFRSQAFGEDYGITIKNGPLAGLLARAVVIIAPSNTVVYTELVPEIGQEPNYDAAVAKLNA